MIPAPRSVTIGGLTPAARTAYRCRVSTDPAPGGQTKCGGRNVAFMGELSDIGVADLLYLLAIRRQTGKLTISANGDEVYLYLDDGQVILVTSSNQAVRLGRMLIRLGILDADRLRDALQEQEIAGRDRPLGSILIARGWISDDDLGRCVEEQCIEALARVITADRGVFVYARGITASRRTEIVPLNTDRILLEATRRTDELSTLRGLLPPPTAPLVVGASIDAEADSLTDTEVLVAATLQSGAGSLAELVDQLGMDEITLWRTVISMRERGLLVVGPSNLNPGTDLFRFPALDLDNLPPDRSR